MAGYSRQDTNNNIANGNVIDADDLDAEFNALEDAFNASTGHNHDGTAGGGATLTTLGPSADLVVNATAVRPKTVAALDIGTTTIPFKDGFFDGTLNTDILSVDETSTFTGVVTATAGVTGDLTGDVKATNGTTVLDSGTDGNNAVLTATVTGDVTGNLTGSIINSDGTTIFTNGSDVVDATFDGNVTGNVTGNADTASAWSASRTVTFATGAVTGSFSMDGSADVTDVDLQVASSITTDVVGDVYASNGTSKILESGTDGTDAVLTGTVSSISNHDTDNLSEGQTNLYYTDTRVDTHLNTSTATTGQLLSYTGTDYDWIDAGSAANYYVDQASWDVQTGVLTLQVSGTTDVTVDLDGRYAEGTIPTDNSQLANGAQYVTSAQAVTTAQLPTNNNQLTNGAQYATTQQIPSVPTGNAQLSNTAGYITSSQAAQTSQIPTNNNQLTNGAGYITSASITNLQARTAIAQSQTGQVGTYAWLSTDSAGTLSEGTVYAGTQLVYAGFHMRSFYQDDTAGIVNGSSPNGQWRAMGDADYVSTRYAATLMLRIG